MIIISLMNHSLETNDWNAFETSDFLSFRSIESDTFPAQTSFEFDYHPERPRESISTTCLRQIENYSSDQGDRYWRLIFSISSGRFSHSDRQPSTVISISEKMKKKKSSDDGRCYTSRRTITAGEQVICSALSYGNVCLEDRIFQLMIVTFMKHKTRHRSDQRISRHLFMKESQEKRSRTRKLKKKERKKNKYYKSSSNFNGIG